MIERTVNESYWLIVFGRDGSRTFDEAIGNTSRRTVVDDFVEIIRTINPVMKSKTTWKNGPLGLSGDINLCSLIVQQLTADANRWEHCIPSKYKRTNK